MASEQNKRNGWSGSLDGLRGAAFLLVLLAHFSNHYDGPFKGIGKPGVWIFFALSAFLLTRNLLADFINTSGPHALQDYAHRRFMRIIPLYYLTISIFLPFGYVVNSENINEHLLLQEGSGHLWTIVAELQFYILLPILIAGHLLVGRWTVRLIVPYWACLWLASLIAFPASDYSISSISLLPYLNVFLAGSFAAIVVAEVEFSSTIASLVGWFSVGIFVVTAPSLWSILVAPVSPGHFYRHQALFGVAAAGLLIGILKSESLAAIFSTRPLRLLGLVSYSGYLIHPLALWLTSHLSHDFGQLAAIALSIGCTAAGTLLLFFLVERPLSKQRRAPRRAKVNITT